jgi:hypothetical protein
MSMQLRELLGEVAQSDVRPDMAQRAIQGARTRRRQRLVVAGSVFAAVVVVFGVVLANGNFRTDSEPRPDDVASLPAILPVPDGLPKLVAGSMDAASTAYVVDGEVVVIDAASGEGSVVNIRAAANTVYGVVPDIGADASLALSPDGRFLMVSSGDPHWEVGDNREWLWMVDVSTGQVALQTSIELASANGDGFSTISRMAWAPDGGEFACVCKWSSGPEQLYVMPTSPLKKGDLTFNNAESRPVRPRQISWGTDGLAAQFDELKADWRLVPLDDQPMPKPERMPPVESISRILPGVLAFPSVAMGHSEVGGFLARIRGGDFWIVTTVGERTVEGNMGDRPILGALGESYFIVFTDWKGEPLGEVTRVDFEGEATLTTLPPGTATISFASELVD